ncbi:MAG: sugar ABC transporter ATP-binding protein, partial [Smithella sp.]
VEENLFLGRLPVTKFGNVNWKELRKRTVKLLKEENLPYSPDQKLKTLTVSDIQMLEIIKAVSNNANIIVMDEPTSAITQREVDLLFEKIKILKNKGVSIIYISHRLDEVFKIADEITVMRDGIIVGSYLASEINMDQVISLMVGRKIENIYPKREVKVGDKLLEVKDFCCKNTFRNISFHLNRGEIVGFAGLIGAGRTEVMCSLFGMGSVSSGTITIKDERYVPENPAKSIQYNMIMLSEDRRRYGIIPVRSVMENASVASLERMIFGGFAHADVENELVSTYFEKMRVKTPSMETEIRSLSGGNQQKVLFAKWMIREPDILILDEPTRGIDVGAKYEIYKLMTELTQAGKGVIMISSELPELIGMCDRIYVMCRGEITGEITDRNQFSQEAIMKLATGIVS